MAQDDRPVLVAPDAFKGTFDAALVAATIGHGLERARLLPPDLCPVADGGEGTLAVLLPVLGGETRGARAHDPLGRPVTAGYALVEDGGTAIVEVAEASGLGRVALEERDAVAASSRGTGELIAAAAEEGAQVVLVCAGGSATTDGGLGAIEALRDAGWQPGAKRPPARIVVLADVRAPFERAADVFAPQKGASPAQVRELRARLQRLAGELPRDPRGLPLSGAAGGLAGGLWAAFGARLEAGAPFVLDAVGFDERMRAARAVVVGEGRLDHTTLLGKVAGEAATRARQAGVPCHAIVGEDALEPFEARMLDLQAILEAPTLDALRAAGERLAAFL